jgi:hypothetical protein
MSELSSKDRIKLLLKLADAAWRDFDQRRSYEWKINFALWAALGSFAGFLFKGGPKIYGMRAYSVYAILFLIGCIYTLLWTRGLKRRNYEDQAAAHHYWSQADKVIGVASPRVRSQFQAASSRPLVKTWSHFSQVAITSLFLIIAALAVSFSGRS